MKINLIALLIAFSSLCFGESLKLTAEYKKFRMEVYREFRATYDSCRNAVGDHYYTKMLERCLAKTEEKQHPDGCGHEAQWETDRYLSSSKETVFVHCEELKGTKEEFINMLEKAVQEKGVRKYEPKT